jgi:hypothetical protein
MDYKILTDVDLLNNFDRVTEDNCFVSVINGEELIWCYDVELDFLSAKEFSELRQEDIISQITSAYDRRETSRVGKEINIEMTYGVDKKKMKVIASEFNTRHSTIDKIQEHFEKKKKG